MARTRSLELPEELCDAIESAASTQGKTVAEWLTNNLPFSTQSEAQGQLSEKSKEANEDAREIWLMQL